MGLRRDQSQLTAGTNAPLRHAPCFRAQRSKCCARGPESYPRSVVSASCRRSGIEMGLGDRICEHDSAPLHPPRQHFSVCVLDQVGELVPRPLHHGVERRRLVSDPVVEHRIEPHVGPEDHADVNELEPLRRVHAAHLLEPTCVRRPKSRTPGSLAPSAQHRAWRSRASASRRRPRPRRAFHHHGRWTTPIITVTPHLREQHRTDLLQALRTQAWSTRREW